MGMLTKDQVKEILHISEKLTKQELQDCFTLYPHDIKNIIANRGADNRLGYAVQLCWLRFTSMSFTDPEEIPLYIVKFIGKQLNISPSLFSAYGHRRQTRSKHLRKICEDYNFRLFEGAQQEIATFVKEDLKAGRSSLSMIENVIRYAKQKHIILPSIGAIEEIVRTSRAEFDDNVIEYIYSQLSGEQCKELNKTLEILPENKGGFSILQEFKTLPTKNNQKSVKVILDKLQKIRGFGINLDLHNLHQNMIRKMSALCMTYNSAQLKRMSEKRRLALMAIMLYDRERVLTDNAINICNRLIYDIKSDGSKRLNQQYTDSAPNIQDSFKHIAGIIPKIWALMNDSSVKETELRKSFFNIFREPDYVRFISATETLSQIPTDSFSLIETSYKTFRPFALSYLELINFKSDTSECDTLINAIEKMKSFYKSPQSKMGEDFPKSFWEGRWESFILKKDGKINTHYYELAFFDSLRTAIGSGNLYVECSYNHRSLNQYLIPKEEFELIKSEVPSIINAFPTADEYIEKCKSSLEGGYKLIDRCLSKNGDLYIEDNQFHIKRLQRESPPQAKVLSKEMYSAVPPVKLPDLLFEVAKWTGFDKCFYNESFPKNDNTPTLMAALMALGTNIGAERMARSAKGLTLSKMTTAIGNYLTEDNLKKAQATLVNFLNKQRIAKYWGTGRTSSSDGMRIQYGVNSLLAEYNPHFGNKKGATFYRFTLDKYATYFVKVINTNFRDARYVIDGLLEHESEIDIEEHYTDTAGYTDQIFGLCHLLGFSFAPRIRNLPSSSLYKIGDMDIEKSMSKIKLNKIDISAIKENYDEVLRVVYSIKKGYVSSSIILSKLSRVNKHNVIAKALQEIGKIEKTLYLQRYFTDDDLRRRVLVGLNKGEAMNGLARVLFFGQDQKIRKKDLMGQSQVALALNILINAICIWNTVYLERVYDELINIKTVDESLLKHISPLNWKHVIYQGVYKFDPSTALNVNQYRELNINKA